MNTCSKIFIILTLLLFTTSFAQNTSESMKRRALQHMQAGRYGEAIDQLNKFIAQNAREGEGYNLRGLCYEQREEYQLSVLDLRRATRLDATNQEYRNNLERVLNTWHQILYQRIDGYQREIAIDPSNPFNYLEVGKSYRWLEEWAIAELWYDRYLERDNNASPDEIIRYTEILSHTGSIRKGEIKLAEWVQRHPDDWRLWSRYGYFTMWLGNYQNAERAFRTALSFKPFFKEAEDGLDLALQQGYLTRESPRSFEREEYPIDRYYRVLRNNPNDDGARYALIDYLMQEKRYEEAYQQLLYLAPNHEGTSTFESLRERITTTREEYYTAKIDTALGILKEDPTDREALIQMVDYYSNMEDYEPVEELLNEYLELIPNDDELRFRLAKVYSYQRKLPEAYEQILIALENNPNNPDYLLLAGQIPVWDDSDLDAAEERLEKVLQFQPSNINAIITLGTLNFQQQEFETAQIYNQRAMSLAPDNPDAQQLNSMLELHFIREEENRRFERLNEGRTLAMNGYYDDAIPYYEEYFSEVTPTTDLKYELADVYVGAERYYDAINMYDEALAESYDLEMDKLRAKVMYWSDDASRALPEFERLTQEDPYDPEIQLYLGDTYSKLEMFDSARTVYNNMLDNNLGQPEIIEERIGWLPIRPEDESFFTQGIRYLGSYLLTYMVVQPVAYVFIDDLDFHYNYFGGNLETSFLPYLSGGVTWMRGRLENDFGGFNYTAFKGNLFIRPIDDLLFRFSYGEMYSPGIVRTPIVEAGVKYDYKHKEGYSYGVDLSYTRTDASTILYSPGLVFTRLTGELANLKGYYEFETNIKLDLTYQLIRTKEGSAILTNGLTTIPENLGNNFIGRIGRKFYPNLLIGYEYLFSDFKYTVPVYYSPQDFNQHSVFAEWMILKNELWEIMVAGKLGYIPQSDYVVRELSGRIYYNISDTFRLMATGFVSNSFREQSGYTSASASISALWSIY